VNLAECPEPSALFFFSFASERLDLSLSKLYQVALRFSRFTLLLPLFALLWIAYRYMPAVDVPSGLLRFRPPLIFSPSFLPPMGLCDTNTLLGPPPLLRSTRFFPHPNFWPEMDGKCFLISFPFCVPDSHDNWVFPFPTRNFLLFERGSDLETPCFPMVAFPLFPGLRLKQRPSADASTLFVSSFTQLSFL